MELQKTSAKLKAIFDTVIDGIITINERGIIDSVNPAALQIFGYDENDLIGRNVKMLMPEPYQSEHDQYLKNYTETGIKKIIGIGREVTGMRKDGTLFPFLLSISEVNTPEGRFFAGMVHDLSGLRSTQEALRETESRLQAIINTMVDGIIVIDAHGKIELFNPAAEKLFDYKKEEVMGKNVNMLMPDPDRSMHDTYMKNYLRTGHAKIIGIGREVIAMKKDGTLFPILLTISEVNLKGRVVFTGLVKDLSKEKLTEEKLRNYAEIQKALEKEMELNEMKSRFVTLASHEFRTPLTTILSSATLVSKYVTSEENDKRQKHIERIKSAVENMTEILNDFLSLSKLEEGLINANPTEVNLYHFCADIADEMRDIKKPGQILTYFHAGDEVANLDKQLLRNVLINLLSNAIKYSPEKAEIIFSSSVKNRKAEITVTDEGMGIPDEDKKYLFDRFFRASNANNTQGTGLGLHIVKKYVELMNGNISYTSELGKGTTFNIKFTF